MGMKYSTLSDITPTCPLEDNQHFGEIRGLQP
jgi:hypothetical protein